MAKKFVRGITDIKNIEHQDFDTNNVNDLLSDGKHNYIHRKKNDGSEEYHNLTDNIKTIQSGDGLVSSHDENTATIKIEPTFKEPGLNLDTLNSGIVRGTGFVSSVSQQPTGAEATFTTLQITADSKVQFSIRQALSQAGKAVIEYRFITGNQSTQWMTAPTSMSEITSLLAKKEQLLESTDETILIEHGENGTEETTTVDVNPEKVLQHDNLQTNYGISKSKSGNNLTLGLEYTRITEPLDLDTLTNGLVRSMNFINAPKEDTWFYVSTFTEGIYAIQTATELNNANNTTYVRCKRSHGWEDWREQVGDKSLIDNLLAQKQNTLTSNTSIGVVGTGLMQLFSYEMSYSKPLEGALNTYGKTVQKDTTLTANTKLEYHFTALLKDGIAGMTVDLEDDDVTYFTCILESYGRASGNTKDAMINGLLFTLNGSRLTVSRSDSTYNQVVSFSDIIEPAQSVQSTNQEQETE